MSRNPDRTGAVGAVRPAVATVAGRSHAPRRTSGARTRQTGPWRDLLVFRARARPDIEVWVGVAGFIVVLGAWLLTTELGLVQPQFLPSPLAVLEAWVGLFQNDYHLDIGISIGRVWVAFAAAAVLAIP
ncbi:MAG TPA: hypothetical protein VK001_04845, partial [Geminicoccaceae bacterium]|nr:hypothetical protein [Geminicoccaceae bacterium]